MALREAPANRGLWLGAEAACVIHKFVLNSLKAEVSVSRLNDTVSRATHTQTLQPENKNPPKTLTHQSAEILRPVIGAKPCFMNKRK